MYYSHTYKKVTVAPALEPVTEQELRAYGKIDNAEDAGLLKDIIVASRQAIEEYVNIAMIARTVEIGFYKWPDLLRLPDWPISSISSVAYYDQSNDSQTWAVSNYDTDINSDPARIELAHGKTWPSLYERPDAVQVTYVAGYGVAATDTPNALQILLKAAAMDIYEMRNKNLQSPFELRENKAICNLAAAYMRHTVI